MADDEAQEAGTGKKSKKLLVIIIAVLVLLLAGGGVATWFMLGGEDIEQTAEEAAPAAKQEAIYVKLRTLGGKPYFIANFTGDEYGTQRFLQVYAEARTRDEETQTALEKHMPMIVHTLSTLFSSQSLRDMQTTEGKERLRQEATEKVKAILQQEIGRPGIDEIFFTNFVMQ